MGKGIECVYDCVDMQEILEVNLQQKIFTQRMHDIEGRGHYPNCLSDVLDQTFQLPFTLKKCIFGYSTNQGNGWFWLFLVGF